MKPNKNQVFFFILKTTIIIIYQKREREQKMVLNLIDICMNSISKNLDQIKYLDVCLTSTQKELLIQRLSNYTSFYNKNLNIIIKSLFTSNIKIIKFYKCDQINEAFLKYVAKNTNFQLKSLTISRCDNVTGIFNYSPFNPHFFLSIRLIQTKDLKISLRLNMVWRIFVLKG